jgi:hypothetical protein
LKYDFITALKEWLYMRGAINNFGAAFVHLGILTSSTTKQVLKCCNLQIVLENATAQLSDNNLFYMSINETELHLPIY